MAAMLTIPVTDAAMARLQEMAVQKGITPEQVVAEVMESIPKSPETSIFLDRWAGAFASNVPDAGANHDRYLGQSLQKEFEHGKPD